MNMITFTARDRARIIALHTDIADAIEAQDGDASAHCLEALERETQTLAQNVFAKRAASAAVPAPSSGTS